MTDPSFLEICEGDAVQFTIHDIIGASVALLGSPGSGKSNSNARIVEQIRPYIPVHILDIHNEYYGLAERFEFLRVGKGQDDGTPPLHIEAGVGQAAEIAEYAYNSGLSVIVQMLYMSPEERLEFTHVYCRRLWELNLIPKKPLAVLLEEAHNFIPQSGANTPALQQLKQFASEGRKFGFTVILSSQRSAKIDKDVLGDCNFAFLHKINILADFQQYSGMTPYSVSEIKGMFLGKTRGTGMKRGEALVKFMHGDDTHFERAQVLKRDTFHVGKTPGLEVLPQVELKMTDSKVVDELKSLLQSPIGEPATPAPVAADNSNEVKRLQGIVDDQKLLIDDHEALIDRLRQQINDLNEELKKAHVAPAPLPVIQPVASKTVPAAPAAMKEQGFSTPFGQTSLPFNAAENWDGRTDLAKARSQKRQRTEFEALMSDLKNDRALCRKTLVYLTQRESEAFTERELAYNLDYSLKNFENQRPTTIERRGLISRKITPDRRTYIYQSTVRTKLRTLYPDLDLDSLVKEVCRIIRV